MVYRPEKVLLLFLWLLCIMYYIWNFGSNIWKDAETHVWRSGKLPVDIICQWMADWRLP